MANSKNIIVGAAQFHVGTALNTIVVKPSAATATGFTHVGFTQDGVEVAYAPDYGDIVVDQLLDSARLFKQGMKVTVNTTFSEATLDNLLVAWGQAGTSAGGVIPILAGALGDAPVERSLLFVGPAPSTAAPQERMYYIARAVQTESNSIALRRTEVTGIPVSFRCLPDLSASGGASYGSITDRAATTLLTTTPVT